MTISKKLSSALICDFCGNRQYYEQRCSKCGGASLTSENDKPLAANSNHTLIRKVTKSLTQLKMLSLFLVICFVSILMTIDDPMTLTGNLFTTVKQQEVQLSDAEIRQDLAKHISVEYGFQFVSLYKGSSADRTTLVHIENTAEPIVLVLSSFEAVTWRLSNPYKVDIRAVIYGSHHDFSEITGDIEPSTIIMQHTDAFGPFKRASVNCDCRSGILRCTGGIRQTVKRLEKLGSGTLVGLTNRSSTDLLRVPTNLISEELLNEVEQRYSLKARKCKNRANSEKEIRDKLTNVISGKYEFVYAGVYHNPGPEKATTLNIEHNENTIVLVLSSYKAVTWRISNPLNVNIKAIIHSSASPGSKVEGDIVPTTLILNYEGGFTGNVSTKGCKCFSGYYSCSKSPMFQILGTVEKFGSGRLSGLSTDYSRTTLRVPETRISESDEKTLKAQLQEYARARTMCDSKLD